ncbi:hypothetical protein V3391_06665 [Luteimonas sp. SMYT11W]|uniref:Uncharacterized protein n=1 Tax=Luteimonas flava TaxID=3115822 RepID=A0ABU7WFG2_9GAMM
MGVYFLHYRCEPATKTEDVQGGTADTCCLAETAADADTMSQRLILSHRWIVQELLACVATSDELRDGWDELEEMLHAKAIQRDPPAAVLFSVWGREREQPELRHLPIPDEGTAQ